MNLIKMYWEVMDGNRRLGVWNIFLTTMSGLTEGLALLTLIPILHFSMGKAGAALPAKGKFETLITWSGLHGKELLLWGLGAFFLFGMLTALLMYLSEITRVKLRVRIEERFRGLMSRALLDMEWQHFISLKTGDISKSIVIEGFQTGVGAYAFARGVGNGLIALVFLGAAFFVSLEMTLYTLCFGVLGVCAYKFVSKKAHRHTDKISGMLGGIGDLIGNIFNSLKFFRATGRTELAAEEAATIYREYAEAHYWSESYGRLIRFVLEGGAIIFIVVFLFIMLYVQEISVARALVFLAVFYRLAPRLTTTQENIYQARTCIPYFWTWKERLDIAREHPSQSFGGAVPQYDKELRLENVSYSYPNAETPALRNLDIRIAKGECVAVVGASGSGKSTLIDLAVGLMPPSDGRITLDGAPFGEMNIEQWRRRVGLVLQESPIFHTSVANNIAWGAETPDLERATNAADMAHALEFINAFPDGMDAVVGEKGGRLSGGQRQRLALARALYREPWLLILDEATSALDSKSELEVQKALERVKGKYSILMIAHRLKTVQMADTILVLEDGRLVEQGGWDELLNKPNGAFRRMAELQGVTGAGNGEA